MTDSTPYQMAALLAARAFERMAKEEHAPTPENYTLWYNYYGGFYPELTKAIDFMVKLGEPITPTRCENLYNKFLANNEEVRVIRSSGEKAYEVIVGTKNVIYLTAQDTELYFGVINKLQECLNEPCLSG